MSNTKIQTPIYLRAIHLSKVQWHTLPVEAYGMTHTALHGRLPRMLRSSGNIQLYTRINLRTYGATPTTLQHSTDTVRSHGVETPPCSKLCTIGTTSTDHRKLAAARDKYLSSNV